MSRDQIGSHKTTVAIDRDDNTSKLLITYHNTIVVQVVDDRYVILNSNGYRTATTKRRMNQASLSYKLGFEVYQVNFCWYVSIGDETSEYYDGIVIDTKEQTISRELKEIHKYN